VDVNTGQAVWQSGFSLNADLVDPAFSHLGDALAFATLNAVDDDIFLLVFETGLLTRLPIPGHQRAPVWSPRGDALLFQSDHDGDWELYLWNGSTLTNVTQNSAADDTYPSWQWLAGPTPASSPGTAPSSLLRSIQSEGVASWRFAPREVGGPELGRLPPEDDSGPATGR
ncbi:MAG: PD40 domain-containing protein, partial [Gemmatimonadales bacterium]|nr:PD40 domain-containing protein [Gemmatimonadales bacterium]